MELKNVSALRNAPLLLAVSIFLQSFSFLSLKVSTLHSGAWAIGFLLLAFGFMGLRAIFWQYLLRTASLSRVYPYTSFVQVLIFAYAVLLFGEAVAINHLVGLGLMLSGIFFMSRK